MSRCFPFPPPGFEIKVRNDPVDLLEKEKIKEKKHKKNKRSKGKKEGKGRKDKDRTKDKRQEKKDQKEKQKDKKKNNGRDKDENTILNCKKNGLQAEGQNAEKLGNSRSHVNQVKKSSNADELHKRIRDEGPAHRMAENIIGSPQRREEGFDAAAAVDKEGRNGNEIVEVTGREKSRNNGLDESAEKDADKPIGWKQKVEDEEKDVKRADRRSERDNQEKRNKENDDGKHKDKEKNKAKGKHINKQQGDIFEENGQNGHVYSLNFQALAPDKDSERCADADGIMNKKRKNFEMNGFLHDALPNKVLREASAHQHAGNGRTSEVSDVSSHSCIGRIGEYIESNKDHKENGFTGMQPPSVDWRHSVAVDTGQNDGASFKLPHPDTRYLSEIYTVPKLEDGAEFDCHNWLFSTDDNMISKPVAMFEDSDIPHVWNEVLQIEAADVFALPYVIPY